MKKLFPFLRLTLSTLGFLFIACDSGITQAQAQITPDGTSVETQVNQNGNVAEITGGQTRGSNLFHSFQDFSVPTGDEAFFNNASDISNIFSRVTGGNISNIDGAIRANGSANLFLINPAGIIFGENARLDIGGSFLGSTGSSILFEDGEFSAVDNLQQPILTVNAPIGLGFRDEPGEIVNNSSANNGRGLEVSGNNLSLLGGNVSFDGGIATAPGGTINLGGLSESGTVNFESDSTFSFPDNVARSNISLSSNSLVDVTADGGGSIAVNANNLELTGESLLLANIGEDLGSDNAVAGTIELNTSTLTASDKSLIQADNLGTGRAGAIDITTDNFDFTDGSAITATTFGVGDAGIINVTAQDITIDREFSGIYSNVGLTNVASESLESDIDGVVGNGGEINVSTNNLSLLNGARIISSSIAQGDGGVVNINATGDVLYQGLGETPVPAFGGGVVISGSFSQVQQEGNGNAGEVNIAADSLTLLDVGAVLTDNSGEGGNAGNITLNIANEIVLDRGALILAQVQEGAVGNGGDIIIDAGSLSLRGDSFVSADTRGQGDAGNIDIDVDGTVSLSGDPDTENDTAILTEVGENAVGNAGNINIRADALTLEDSVNITAQTKGQGDAGNITLEIANEIVLDKAALIQAQVQDGAVGNGGDIIIDAGSLNLRGDSFILADTRGQGDAGNIDIDADGTVTLTDNPETENITAILSEVGENAVGNAGNINIQANALALEDGADIAAQTKGQGDAGNITITTDENISLSNNSEIRSLVEANATGNGGNVFLNTGELNLTNSSQIIADTTGISPNEGGISTAGDIQIDVSGDINLENSNQIQSQTRNGAVGNAGNITIDADGSLFSRGGNFILADSQATGNGGNINIEVGEQIVLEGLSQGGFPSQIVAGLTREDSQGTGGNIEIKASELILTDVAFISSNVVSNSIGDAGNITVDVNNLRLSENSWINVLTANDNGRGGAISINAQTLDLVNGGKILAATDGGGDAGNVNFNISDRLTIDYDTPSSAEQIPFPPESQLLNEVQQDPSGIYANATANSTGNGGNVNIGESGIVPQEFIISNNGQIVADSEGAGNGGSIFLNSKTLSLDNGRISASTQSSTESDRSSVIDLDIEDALTLNNQSLISAQAFNDANGGNLDIDARFVVAFSGNNDILASAEDGIGGNIAIDTESLLGIEERQVSDSTNDINASSNFNLDGTVDINILNFDPIQGVAELPRNVVEPQDTIAQACRADRTTAKNANSFIVIGKGGVTPLPDAPLNSAGTIVDGRVDNNLSAIPQAIATSNGKIKPARGIKVAQNGEIILTAYQTNNAGDRITATESNCGVDKQESKNRSN